MSSEIQIGGDGGKWAGRAASVMRLGNERARRRGKSLSAWLVAAYEGSEGSQIVLTFQPIPPDVALWRWASFGRIQKSCDDLSLWNVLREMRSAVHLIWRREKQRGQILRFKDALCHHLPICSRHIVSKSQSEQGHVLIRLKHLDSLENFKIPS